MNSEEETNDQQTCRPACPACGGELMEIRAKLPRMILRLSTKLNTKIKAGTLKSMPLDENPYADWSCHLFTADRAQYILMTNTQSLYSSVMFGRGITDAASLSGR